MRVDKNIEKNGNRYLLYMYDRYCGCYSSLENAQKAREQYRKNHKTERRKANIEGFTERFNTAIWNSNKDVSMISKQSHVSRTAIWSYQNGSIPKADNLARLAIVLNVSTDWLLGITTKKRTILS